MNTISISIQKQKAENFHSNHQIQISKDKNKNQDQHHEENGFEPAQQRGVHEKAVVDNSSLKSSEECIGYRRFRERVNSKRTKGDKECCTPRLFGNKYRHCKVSTSKGLRDRRVRLSANTAIDFYDVQDRLGFDRPSNAIDWLMKEAEAAISALHKDSYTAQLATFVEKESEDVIPNQTHHRMQLESKFLYPRYSIYQANQQLYNDNADDNFGFTSLLCGMTSSTSLDFPIYQHGFEPMIGNQNQHLCLSLQSHLKEPALLHQNMSPYSLAEHDSSVLLGSNSMNCNKLPNSYWFQNISSENCNSKLSALHSLEGQSEPFREQNQMYLQRESLQPSFLPSTYTSTSKTDYDQMLAFNGLSGISTGVYSELQDS